MKTPDIWNFHSSLTLNNGKPIIYFGSLLYAIVSNMTNFVIPFGMGEKCHRLKHTSPVLAQNLDIWNFHGSLALKNGTLI